MSELPSNWQWLDQPLWKILLDIVLSVFDWLLGL